MSLFRHTARAVALGVVAGALSIVAQPAQAVSVSEGFDNVAALTTWKVVNLSEPGQPEEPSWSQGNPDQFTAHSGAPNSFIGIDWTSGGNDVSSWLILPQQTSLSSTDVLSFWTKSANGTGGVPDRLEIRMSTNGSCNPGATTEGVGDFTTLLGSINPTLADTGYPADWTQVSYPLTGLSTTNVSGCLALRYYITGTNTNGDYVGVDSLTFADNASTACTAAQASATSAQATVTAATATAASTTKAVKKAKKKLKKARKALKNAKKAGDDAKETKAKKKVKKAVKKAKKAKKKNKAATSALATAQTALASAQATSTTSCP